MARSSLLNIYNIFLIFLFEFKIFMAEWHEQIIGRKFFSILESRKKKISVFILRGKTWFKTVDFKKNESSVKFTYFDRIYQIFPDNLHSNNRIMLCPNCLSREIWHKTVYWLQFGERKTENYPSERENELMMHFRWLLVSNRSVQVIGTQPRGRGEAGLVSIFLWQRLRSE